MLSASNASDSSSGANASVFAATFAATGVTQWLPVDGRHGEWALPMQDVTFGDEVLEAFGTDGCRAVLDSGCGGIVLPAEVGVLCSTRWEHSIRKLRVSIRCRRNWLRTLRKSEF